MSSDVNEKMGGISVIGKSSLAVRLVRCPAPCKLNSVGWLSDELIEVPYEENETKILRFANYLRMVFQQPGDSTEQVHELLEMAANALGRLVFLRLAIKASLAVCSLIRSRSG